MAKFASSLNVLTEYGVVVSTAILPLPQSSRRRSTPERLRSGGIHFSPICALIPGLSRTEAGPFRSPTRAAPPGVAPRSPADHPPTAACRGLFGCARLHLG